jgi:hypothetical protein
MDRLLSAMTRHVRRSHRTSRKTRTGLRQERRTRLNLELLEDRLAPAIYMVNALTDTGAGTGLSGDLRYAINNARTGDTIQFQAGLTGTIDLSTAEGGQGTLALGKDVTIDGTGASITIEGGKTPFSTSNAMPFQVLQGVTAILNNLTISNGYANKGGGINNAGKLTVSNCTITTSAAGSFGGGIYNSGTLIASNSTVSANTVFAGDLSKTGDGGGIYNALHGTATVSNSTLLNNSAFRNGGAIANYGTLNVGNSTLSGNQYYVSGGGIYNDGALTVGTSTIAYNYSYGVNNLTAAGGGIYNDSSGSVKLTNTIVADSLTYEDTPSGSDLYNDGTITTAKSNLIQSQSGKNLIQNVNAYSDNILNQDPLLAPLGEYGGSTRTFALLSGSQAVGGGDGTLLLTDPATDQPYTTDQRGLARVVSGRMDIGAVESQPLVVNTMGDGTTTAFAKLSLRQAIALADVSSVDVTITFDSTVFPTSGTTSSTITLTDVLALAKPPGNTRGTITIQGPGANLLTIDGNNKTTVFAVGYGTTAILSGLTIADGMSPVPPEGGGIGTDGTLTVSNCIITHNASTGAGIVNNQNGMLTLDNCVISNNSSTGGDGGGIYNAGTLTVNSSTISGNSNNGPAPSTSYGGGIYNTGKLTVTNSTLSGNTVATLSGNTVTLSGLGGGICSFGGSLTSLTVINSTLEGNSALTGGGIAVLSGTASVGDSTIADNTASVGGGIINYATLNLTNTIVAKSTDGLDLYNYGTVATAENNLIQSQSGTQSESNPISNSGNSHSGNIFDKDPLLSDLANSGGPTQTMALQSTSQSTSPALGKGNVALAVDANGNPLLTDQRGFGYLRTGIDSNTQTPIVDIGAYQTQATVSPTAYLQKVVNGPLPTDPTTGNPTASLSVDSQDQANNLLTAFQDPSTPDFTQLSPPTGTTTDISLTVPAGISLNDTDLFIPQGIRVRINGGTWHGGSPALTLASGDLTITGATFVNDTDAPTILVTGGNLTLRNDTVESSTGGFNDPAIAITGGTVDLGTVTDPGNNTLDVNGTGPFVQNSTANAISEVGVTFQLNGVRADYWTGGGSDNLWSDPNNWQGDLAPQPGDILFFTGTPQTTVNDFPSNTAFSSIRFLSPSGWGAPDLPTWNLNGNEVVLGGADAIVDVLSPAGESIINFNLPIQLSSDLTFTAFPSRFGFGGSIDTNGYTFTVNDGNPSSEVFFDGDISGSGGIVQQGGNVYLVGNNSYTGPTLLQSGNCIAGSPTAFGNPSTSVTTLSSLVNCYVQTSSQAGSFVLESGSLLVPSAGTILSGPIVSHGGGIQGTATITGPVTVDGYLLLWGQFSVSGNITESSPNSKVEDRYGSVTLNGSCTLSGPIIVIYGATLEVDGTLQCAAVQVSSQSTIKGTGTINAPVQEGSIFYPPDTMAPGNPLGVLTTGDLSLYTNETFSATLDGPAAGTQYSQLAVNGSVNLGSRSTLQLTLDNNYTPALGTTFTIINNEGSGPVNGTFAGLPEGSVFAVDGTEFSITYLGGDGNDVVLIARPPPAPVVNFANVAFDPITGSVHFGLSATDSTSERIAAGFTYVVDFGDGQGFTTPAESADPSRNGFSHPYGPGIYAASVTAIGSDGVASLAASALIVISDTPGDTIEVSGGRSPGQVSIGTTYEGQLKALKGGTLVDLALVGAFGDGGVDAFSVDFGSTLTTPITFTDYRTNAASDTLTANGDSSPTNTITKTPGQITWGSPVTETVSRTGIPNTVVNANGTSQNYINDPGGSTTINGGPGANTITITATTGSGVVINGGPNANTYIVDLGSLAGPVTIQNPNTAATNSLVVNGAPGNNTITVAGNQVASGTQTITDTASLTNLTVSGGPGNNQLTVSTLTVPVQSVTLAGGSGTNTYNVNAGTVNVVAGTGVNVLNATGGTVGSIKAPPGTSQPLVFAHSYYVLDNGALSVPASGVLANDVSANGKALTAVLASGPAHGNLILNADGSFTYKPVANFVGTDSFTYQAKGSDGTLSVAAPVTIQVSYHFSGFLAPLHANMTYALGRTIPIKFQLTDANGHFISSLGAIASLQIASVNANGGLGTPFNPTAAGGTSLTYDTTAKQYVFNWQTKGLAAGNYMILLSLSDGSIQSLALTLSSSGAFQLTDGTTSPYASSTANQVLYGTLTVAVQDDTGNGLDASEVQRISDAMTYLNDALGSFGVSLSWAAPGTDADVHVHFASNTPERGDGDGVLGFTTADNDVYIVTTGWNFYTDTDPSGIGAGQYDFLTLATHELAHTVGLGESSDPNSVMYEYLAPGTVRRTFTDSNLSLINTDADRFMKAALPTVPDSANATPLEAAFRAQPPAMFPGAFPSPLMLDRGNENPFLGMPFAGPVDPHLDGHAATIPELDGDDSLLVGGAGNDLLIGGAGRNLMAGGFGFDQVTANGAAKSPTTCLALVESVALDQLLSSPGLDLAEMLAAEDSR